MFFNKVAGVSGFVAQPALSNPAKEAAKKLLGIKKSPEKEIAEAVGRILSDMIKY